MFSTFKVHNVTKKANKRAIEELRGRCWPLTCVNYQSLQKLTSCLCPSPKLPRSNQPRPKLVTQMFHSRYETNNCCKKWMSKIVLDVDILMLSCNMKMLHVNISILHELWRVQRQLPYSKILSYLFYILWYMCNTLWCIFYYLVMYVQYRAIYAVWYMKNYCCLYIVMCIWKYCGVCAIIALRVV